MWALVISAPFFDTSIMQLHSWTTIIRPYFYFGGLLLLRKTLDMVITKRVWINLSSEETRWLSVFCVIIVLSLFMPALLEGEEDVLPTEIGPGRSVLEAARIHGMQSVMEPLHLGRINFTQALYPLFMVLFFFAITNEIKTPKQLHGILKINVGLGVLVVLTGIFYQTALASGNIEIVDRVYSFITGRPQIRRHGFMGIVPQMYSVVGEAGFTGAFLLSVLGLVAIPIITGRTDLLWGKRISQAILVFLLIGLLLTGGTTGYMGLFIFLGALLFLPCFRKRTKEIGNARIIVRALMITAGFFFLAYLLFVVVLKLPLFSYLYQRHFSKLLAKTGSGIIRYNTAMNGLGLFIRHPLLGVGIGSNRTSALIPTLLSNIGLLGTIPFLLFNWIIFRKGLTAYRKAKNSSLAIIALASVVCFVSLFGAMSFGTGVTSLLYLHYWILLAMILAAYRFYKMELA